MATGYGRRHQLRSSFVGWSFGGVREVAWAGTGSGAGEQWIVLVGDLFIGGAALVVSSRAVWLVLGVGIWSSD